MRSTTPRRSARLRTISPAIAALALGAGVLALSEGTALADAEREVFLKVKHSGKHVDISGVGLNVGDKVHQWSFTGADNQRFILTSAGGGYYYLRAKHSGLYLDVYAWGQSDGTQILQWSYTGTENQQFKFEPTPDGYYTLRPRHAPTKCVDVAAFGQGDGATIQLWTCTGADNQKISLIHDERFDREISFAAKHSDKCLDVRTASQSAGALVQQWTCADVANQRFRLSLSPDWHYSIVATHSNKCLELSAGTSVTQQPCNGQNAQKFKLANGSPDEDHYFYITSADQRSIGIAGSSQSDGALASHDAADAKPFEILVVENNVRMSLQAQIANKYLPHLMIDSAQACNPLTFKESRSLASFEDTCKGSFSPDFAVFSNVYQETSFPGGSTSWRRNTFRVAYGVAFGWQSGEADYSWAGAHGHDAQYIVVDVIDGQVSSVWADLHQGSYARSRGAITMHDGTHVAAWVGRKYNSLKLVDDTTSMCDSDITYNRALGLTCYRDFGVCSCPLDSVLNWGDPVDEDIQAYGKIVMVEHACSADPAKSYTSDAGVTYSPDELAKLRAYMGCEGASYQWGDEDASGRGKNTFLAKPPYTDPYGLEGCNGGDVSNGGDICNASVFSWAWGWRTVGTYRDIYLEGAVAGAADVDYSAGAPFNDIDAVSAVPSSVTIRTGARVDRVSVTYANGQTISHGGSGGSEYVLDNLVNDPIVKVRICGAWKDGKRRAGRIELSTRGGRSLAGGNGNVDCQDIAPAGKRFMAFYGRSGAELDILGTLWGNMSDD